ncbi:cation:proton antiporter [Methylolobus aquaticus]|nr:cation:proton antiporter [Methylolobus aquaticus]
MEVHTFFLHLMVILIAARCCAELAAWLQTPPVVGELCAGIVLGPSVLAWLQPEPVLRLLAEIGIILLLFEAGLDTDIRQLARAGVKSALVAGAGFVLPFALGWGLCELAFGLPRLVSLFVGGTLTATSIGITIRVLTDLKRRHQREAQIVLGAAVIDDILGVVLLAVLYEFSIAGAVQWSNAGRVLVFVGIFFVLAPVMAKLLALLVRHLHAASRTKGLIPTVIVSLVLFFAWLAHEVGAPEMLGGFAAGLALSRRFFLPLGVAFHTDSDFAERVEQDMQPIVQLFTPIFFVMVGLSLDLTTVDWDSPFIWMFSALVFAVALAGKMAGAAFAGERPLTTLAIGLAMVPRGEVGLIFAQLGRSSGILSNEIHAALVIVIALTTLLPPFLMKAFYARFGHRLSRGG